MEQHDHEVLIPGTEHHLLEVETPKASGGINVRSKLTKPCCDCCCYFSEQQSSVPNSEQWSKSTAKLCGLVFFYLIVMAVEIVGGLKSNSLAILTDAGHLLTDICGFSVSLFAMWASGWSATPHQSFGFGRIEVLGALLSVQLIWIVSGYLIFEAIGRIIHKQSEVNGALMFPIASFGFVINFIMVSGYLIFEAIGRIIHKQSEVNGALMFPIASFGFVINFIMVMWLGHGHSHDTSSEKHHDDVNHEDGQGHSHDTCTKKHHHDVNHEEGTSLVASTSKGKNGMMNINIEAAYLHVMVDMIQSVGVMIAGVVIWLKPEWLVVDLVCTLIFSALAIFTTLPMLRNMFSILMESTPSEVNVVGLETDLNSIKGVHNVHDIHVWAITKGKNVMTCHIILEPSVNYNEILHKVKDLCKRRYVFPHVTAQIESL